MYEEAGSPVLIEVELKKQVPFGSKSYFDPTVAIITVTDSTGAAKVNGENLIKSATGKYYYIVATQTDWVKGFYDVVVNITDVSGVEVEIRYADFILT